MRTDNEVTDTYLRNADSVYRVAYLYMGNQADAEDMLQNVFIRYINSSVEFNDTDHERAWFIRVTKNACTDSLRSVWNVRRDDIESINQSEAGSYTDKYSDDSDSELLNCIKGLKKNYRVTLYLYYYEEYSVREIAELTGRKESTIQTWLAAGRGKLKKMIGGAAIEESI